MGLFSKIFGSYSDHQIKKIKKYADQIEALGERFKNMSDDELRSVTDDFKKRYAEGESLDSLLPEAFAAVREADDRVLGKRPFYVQLLGGIILHQGRIAEMKTGEGKTLVATMPAYLNALTGRGVHIITVNDYLARRDSEEMGRVYEFLGLTTGLIFHGQSREEKQAAYRADITYGTNNEFGFDYLRDNMVVYKEQMTQRGYVFAIIDEVDSILIDEARTPLIISGEGKESTDMYGKADRFACTLKKFVIKELDEKTEYDDIDADYIVNEKKHNVILTPRGAKKAESFFGVENFTEPENAELAHYVNNAIRAHGIMHLDEDYVVNDSGVVIVDSFTGRLMPGRRYSDGLHQAIEAKEHVKVQKENRTLATITFQNLFRMYEKLSGMTGTALTEQEEFRSIYSLDVVEVPTNKPMIRLDHPDNVYKTVKGKYDAIIRQIKECHEKGQPVLVGTITIDKSEDLSARLRKEGIKHNVLNAKYHEREAEIVAQAGRYGAVTISTNMAGRGTDIMLGGNPEFMAKTEMRKDGIPDELIAMATGSSDTDDENVIGARNIFRKYYDRFKEEIAPEAEKVRAAGGLFILGTERHESRRIDNQLRGRSGRQGDPGESRFFISFEDDLIRLFAGDRIQGIVDHLGIADDEAIDMRILSNAIETAQRRIEDTNFKRRRDVLTYDDVMNQQRAIIYKQRGEVLNGDDVSDTIIGMIKGTISDAVEEYTRAENHEDWDLEGLRSNYMGLLCTPDDFAYTREDKKRLKKSELTDLLTERAMKLYEEKEQLFGTEVFREVERSVLLRNVDSHWMDHIDAMDNLEHEIGLQAYAQRDPVNEYRIVGAEMFDSMVSEIRDGTVRMILSVMPRTQSAERVSVAKETGEGFSGSNGRRIVKRPAAPQKPKGVTISGKQKIGRNDPCPCGSGKKYKNCCGANPNKN